MKQTVFLKIIICLLIIFPLKTHGVLLKGGNTFDTAVELTPGVYEGEAIRGGEKESETDSCSRDGGSS